MGLRIRIFLCITYSLFAFIVFLNSGTTIYADTSIYRSAGWVATDGNPAYINTTGCQVSNDGLYCSRPNALSSANLYFSSFGSLSAFGIPQNAVITKVHMRIRGRNNVAQYVGVMDIKNHIPFQGICEFPSDLWTFGLGATDSVWEFHTVLTAQNKLINCITAQSIDAEKLTFRINRAGPVSWWADIDNFEIAFDYDPPPPPAPLKTPLIIIPGIGGSELKTIRIRPWLEDNGHGGIFAFLYSANEIVWVNEAAVLLPELDDYFDILRMKSDGIIPEEDLGLTGDLYARFYQSTIDSFKTYGYALNKDLFVFSYDWRKDNTLAVELLGQK
ncbi:MAG: hypothetical protein HYT11_00975, partial [Candidatus Levybacteria bacterium]|nr:hypothetical protein [Candidatus Levybacteria bacterium]